jgi:Protein of unknown function (DUF3352)
VDQQPPTPDEPQAPAGGDAGAGSTWPGSPAPPPVATNQVPPVGRKSGGRAIALVLAAIVVLGGVAFAAVRLVGALSGSSDVLAKMVPATSDVYVTAYLDPGAGQKLNLRSLASKFPALQGKDLGKSVDEQLERLLRPTGLDYLRDVKPWVGSQLAVTAQVTRGGPSLAVLVASKDDALAGETFRRLEGLSENGGVHWTTQMYKGVAIRVGTGSAGLDGGVFGNSAAYAIVDHTVVVGTGATAVEGIVDADQGSTSTLADDASFTKVRDSLPKSVLGLAYVNVGDLVDGFLPMVESQFAGPVGRCGQTGAQALEALRAYRGLALSLSAESDGVSLDVGVAFDRSKLPSQLRDQAPVPDHQNAVLSFTPRQAYGLVALTGADRLAGRALSQLECAPGVSSQVDQLGIRDLIGNLAGDLGLEVGPGTGPAPGGAVVAAVNDDTKVRTSLNALALRLAGGSAQVETRDYKGTAISSVRVPRLASIGWEPAWAIVDHTAIVASSADEVEATIDAHTGADVTQAPTFRQASGHVQRANQGMVYVDVGAILDAVRASIGPSETAHFDDVTKNVRPVKAMVLAGTNSGDLVQETWFILIR